MMEGNENSPDVVLEENKTAENSQKPSELEHVFVIILLGLLGIGAFLMIATSGGISKSSKDAPIEVIPQNGNTNNPKIMQTVTSSENATHFKQAETSLSLYYIDGNVCVDECLNDWTPYVSLEPVAEGKTFTLVREDTGENQLLWKGKFLYTYNKDKPGETNGDGVGGVWHLVRP